VHRRGAGSHRQSAKNWDRRVDHVERIAAGPGFQTLRDLILGRAQLSASDRLLDVGAGTGLLVEAAAPRVARVIAIDSSPAMCRHLEQKLARLRVENARVFVNDATNLQLEDDAIDVVVSNYCLHHLRDEDKLRALTEIKRVLRPGGRLVFADMMFQLGVTDRRDLSVLTRVVARMVRHGPAGWLRLLKNAMRILTGRWEHPAGVEWWHEALVETGFTEVRVHAISHEGGLALAQKPGATEKPDAMESS
jgi:ubiquinone/menaquinone biosynthesis C-methylase UbiE